MSNTPARPDGGRPYEVGETIQFALPVTDEMVECAAQAVHALSGHRSPGGRLTPWADLTPFQLDQFRRQARGVLAAAARASGSL